MLRRLVWQEYRQARASVMGLALAGAAILAMMPASRLADLVQVASLMLIALASSALGAAAFQTDDTAAAPRYLAYRGVAAWRVWLAKQVVWGAGTILTAMALSAVALLVVPNRPRYGLRDDLIEFFYMALPLGLALALHFYAAGQWASILCRRGLVAVMLGLVIGLPLLAMVLVWSNLIFGFTPNAFSVWSWYGEEGWIGKPFLPLVPAPLGLLVLSLSRADDWLLERASLRARLRLAANVALPAIVAPLAFVLWRIHGVPDVGEPFPVARVVADAVPPEQDAAPLYRRAMKQITPDPAETAAHAHPAGEGRVAAAEMNRQYRLILEQGWAVATPPWQQWVSENAAVLEVLAEAASRERCVFASFAERLQASSANKPFLVEEPKAVARFQQLLLLDARRLEEVGQLAEALERYQTALRLGHHLGDRAAMPYLAFTHVQKTLEAMGRWLAHPKQDAALIQTALGHVEQLPDPRQYLLNWIEVEHVFFDRMRREHSPQEILRLVHVQSGPDEQALLVRWVRLPWEAARERRLRHLLTAGTLAAARKERYERVFDDRPRRRWRWQGWSGYSMPTFQWGSGPAARTFTNGEVAYLINTTPMVRLIPHDVSWGLTYTPDMVLVHQRATVQLLAIRAWQLERGNYPARLEELVRPYLPSLPADPFGKAAAKGEPFLYRFAQGETLRIYGQDYRTEAGQPILYSRGGDGRDDSGLFDERPPRDRTPYWSDILFPMPRWRD